MVELALEQSLKKSGINQRNATQAKGSRRSIMRSHGFRKFVITMMDKAGVKDTHRRYLTGHAQVGQDRRYVLPKEEDMLAEYVKVIPYLTIDPNQRLKQENADLRKAQSDYLAELGDLRHDFDEMKQLLVHLSKESQKQLVDEFFQKVGDKADIEWSCD
jgi:hypothetical protein